MQCLPGPLAGQLVIHNKLEAVESQLPCRGWKNVSERRVNGGSMRTPVGIYVCESVSVDVTDPMGKCLISTPLYQT